MLTVGKHFIVELSECSLEVLNDLSKVKEILSQAAVNANTEVKELAFHHFYPQGVSGVVVIAESHISIHTWPENGYAALDIYTCGDKADPRVACDYIAKEFNAKTIHMTEINRGIPDSKGLTFTHENQKR
jgi:S-adenosylmethionine decarboxylase